jgi:hypothetical protein
MTAWATGARGGFWPAPAPRSAGAARLARIPQGGAFHPRCALARDRRRTDVPALREFAHGRRASACHVYEEVMGLA